MSYINDKYPDIVKERPLWIRSTYLADVCAEVDRLRTELISEGLTANSNRYAYLKKYRDPNLLKAEDVDAAIDAAIAAQAKP